jgi:hypothetical protein
LALHLLELQALADLIGNGRVLVLARPMGLHRLDGDSGLRQGDWMHV